jgi:Golgi SNAP receptor complex protein 1
LTDNVVLPVRERQSTVRTPLFKRHLDKLPSTNPRYTKYVDTHGRRLGATTPTDSFPRNPGNTITPQTIHIGAHTDTPNQTETLFSTYSQYATSTTLPPKPSEEELRLETQLRTLLDQRATLIASLTRLLDSESALTSSALKQNNLSRHREILSQHTTQLSQLKASIQSTRQKAHLLTSVRSDIESYRQANPAGEEADYMLDERARIDRSHGIADTVLAQAYAVNENFGIQRETLASVNRRIVGAASQVPGINSLIQRIGAKKRRDGIVLAVFIAFCLLMLLYFR